MENTSGQGSQAMVPKEVKGWNWGAFLLNWIWGIGNHVWLALIILIPLAGFIITIVAGIIVESYWGLSVEVWPVLFLLMLFIAFIMAIVLGMKGSEWAWQKKRWDSIEHFRRTQKSWAISGISSLVVCLGLLAAIIIPNIGYSPRYTREEVARIELHNVQTAVTTMMTENNLKTLPNPVSTATSDMSSFPDATSVAGSADKAKDPNGNAYQRGDRSGYRLEGHDMTGDNERTNLVDYIIVKRYTKGTYIVDATGKVTQVTKGLSKEDWAASELADVQSAVTEMMMDNNLSRIPNPVSIATNDMSAFPDAASVAGSPDKAKGPNGNPYQAGDKSGYLLYGHDITGDNKQTPLVNYIDSYYLFTKGTYTVDVMGKVTQVTKGLSKEEVAAWELAIVQSGVTAMMVDNNLTRIPNPVSIATDAMGAFPDATSVAGSPDKAKDPNGNPYRSGDKNGYLLYGHDMTGDNDKRALVDYVYFMYIRGTYTVDETGKVTQVTFHY